MNKEYKNIIYIYLILLFIGIFPMLLFDNIELFIKINKMNNIYLDNFFYYISFLGNGYFYIGLFFLLTILKVKNKYLFGAGFGFILTTLIIKSMKELIFKSYSRPSALVPTGYDLHIVKNMILKKESSFPSGHASIVFAMICFLALLIKPKFKYLVLFFILASLVSFSRIYLGQHFYRDIYIGALIGGTSTLFSLAMVNRLKKFEYFLNSNMLTLINDHLIKKIKNNNT